MEIFGKIIRDFMMLDCITPVMFGLFKGNKSQEYQDCRRSKLTLFDFSQYLWQTAVRPAKERRQQWIRELHSARQPITVQCSRSRRAR